MPTVLIGLPREPAGLACVDLDFRAAGALCVDHLADLGHREMVLLGAPEAAYARHAGFAVRTVAGAAERAAARGVRLTHRTVAGDWDSVAGTLARVLAERPRTPRPRAAVAALALSARCPARPQGRGCVDCGA
ncbi:hypothetical protein ACIHCV_41590 [Streptomyces sp. NPDC051956]|uniref:hypothetical protein n=1 Tax=Streptomyces sp. NPDC051956 TaxID=3365677 RepID=UPI0037D7FC1D